MHTQTSLHCKTHQAKEPEKKEELPPEDPEPAKDEEEERKIGIEDVKNALRSSPYSSVNKASDFIKGADLFTVRADSLDEQGRVRVDNLTYHELCLVYDALKAKATGEGDEDV